MGQESKSAWRSVFGVGLGLGLVLRSGFGLGIGVKVRLTLRFRFRELRPSVRLGSKDQLALDLQKMVERVQSEVAEPSVRDKIIAAIKKGKAAASNEVPRGQLKVGKKSKRQEVNKANIVDGKRLKQVKFELASSSVENSTPKKSKNKAEIRGSLPKRKARNPI